MKPVESGPVSIIERMQEGQITTVDDVDQWMPHSGEDAEEPCTVTRATILAPVSETTVWAKSSAVRIHVVETHENFIKRRQALVAQVLVDTAPAVPLTTTVTNLSSSCAHIEGMKVAICTAASHVSFGSIHGDTEPDSVNGVQISNAHRTKKEILERSYNTKQQNATLQEIVVEKPSKSTRNYGTTSFHS